MRDALGSVQSLLVLGGTSEIGVATARTLVNGRARRVVLACRDPRAAGPAVEDLRRAGAGQVDTLRFDALERENHERFVDDAFARFGEIDLVLLAFGVLTGDPVDVIETNFVAAVAVLEPLARRMVRQGHGTIVVLSSVAGERVRRANYVYGASKAGLDGFAQGLADSLAGTGVRVMVVRPGFVRTKMTASMKAPPLSATPEQVAHAIARGLSHGSETVWVPAAMRPLMWVVRHLPRAVFRRLPF
ncbi:MAG TPA: decaprenylphospho-beta-D-erythro-pentofuranosid-2-ulose 2-reductase [Thermoleophilaceae bacterium]